MKKKHILFLLEKEYKKAMDRQLPGATKESGHMRGLSNAIRVIKKAR